MAVRPNDYESGYEESRFKTAVDENFYCSICFNVVKEARMCQHNEHIFCRSCIEEHLRVNAQRCPQCQERLTAATLHPARVINNMISKLKINCNYANRGCPEFINVEDLEKHVKNCGFAPVLCSNERCDKEINKRDKIKHETELCEYRKTASHYFEEIKKMFQQSFKDQDDKVKMQINEIIRVNRKMDEDRAEMHRKFTNVCGQYVEIRKEMMESRKEIKEVQQNLSTVTKEMMESKKEIKDVQQNLFTVNQIMMDSRKEMMESKKEIKDVQQNLFTVSQIMMESRKEMIESKKEMMESKKEIKNVQQNFFAVSKIMMESRREMMEVKNEIKNVQQNLFTVTKELMESKKVMLESRVPTKDVQQNLFTVTKEMEKMKATMLLMFEKINKQLDQTLISPISKMINVVTRDILVAGGSLKSVEIFSCKETKWFNIATMENEHWWVIIHL
ncbi:TNF receptor-associated factor 3-like [Xenia sp. Carnegie-2017]|uniref:TNF receptor-associated factor 3-like n=1 Tax=Xenia sp. Carnegie-2017 TaxID=2897299 RepID=UPI001F047566|nr:TNF receptor-associated factor 3-like [Xenia sp. Carnegie-2017]